MALTTFAKGSRFEAFSQPQERDEAADAIRALIEKITLTPGAKRSDMAAALHGELGTILEWTARRAQKSNSDTSFGEVSDEWLRERALAESDIR